MQTSATTHVQLCSVPGCLEEAQVTLAHGKYVQSPVGICRHHTKLDLPGMTQERKAAEDNKILSDLGFDINGFMAA